MMGISLAGVRVESPRRKTLAARHPLGNATVEEARAALIKALKGAGHTRKFIAEVLRVKERQVSYDAIVPTDMIGRRDEDAA